MVSIGLFGWRTVAGKGEQMVHTGNTGAKDQGCRGTGVTKQPE